MVWYVFVVEAIVFAVLFTTILFATYHGDRIYSPACIHNYPPDIQEEYFKTHERVDVSYKSKKVVIALLVKTEIKRPAFLIESGPFLF